MEQQDKLQILQKIDNNRLLIEDILKHMVRKPMPKDYKEEYKVSEKTLVKKGQSITAEELLQRREELRKCPEKGIPLKEL